MGSGICAAALVRAATALLTALGGDQVTFLLPATAMAGDAAGQLGLVDPGAQEVLISPVVIHNVPVGNSGPRRRIEVTVPAEMINAQLAGLAFGTAEEFFNAVLGMTYGSDLFHVESVVPENFAGTAYFFLVTAVE